MLYIPAECTGSGVAQVIYTGKNSRVKEQFTALDWLARLVTHIPGKGEQLVRYYGYYSNKARGMRKKAMNRQLNTEDVEATIPLPSVVDSDMSRKAFRKNWARLIRKVYGADPLLCPKCSNSMRIISFVEEEAVIKKILIHLNLWLPGNHDPPEEDKPFQTTIEYGNILEVEFDTYQPIYQMPFEDAYSQVSPYDDRDF